MIKGHQKFRFLVTFFLPTEKDQFRIPKRSHFQSKVLAEQKHSFLRPIF